MPIAEIAPVTHRRAHFEDIGQAIADVNGGDKLCQMAARKCTSRVKREGFEAPVFIFVLLY